MIRTGGAAPAVDQGGSHARQSAGSRRLDATPTVMMSKPARGSLPAMLLGNLHEMRNFALRTKWALVDMAHDIEIPTCGIRLHYCHQLSAKSTFGPEVEKTVLI